MLENVRGTDLPHPNLKICKDLPGMSPLLAFIRADRIGGEPLRQNISSTAQIMGREWLSEKNQGKSGLVIGIPRGGRYMGIGLSKVTPMYKSIETNHGIDRDPNAPIVQLDVIKPQKILIADTALFSGKTVMNTLECILPQVTENTEISVFIAIAFILGLQQVCGRFGNVNFYVGEIEMKSRPIYDPHFVRLFQTLANMGDIGELVSRP